MKFTQHDLDEELEEEHFAKIKSKKQILKGRQAVGQLISREADPADPDAKFEQADLNELSREGYLDELISGIKTGKEASVYLGRNWEGLVAVKVYTDLRVRSFKRDHSYRQGRYIGDFRIEKAIEQGSKRGLDLHQALWVQEEFKQMQFLHQHGVRVPKAIAVNGIAIVMEFIGDEIGHPAPRISDLKMEKDEAHEAFRQSIQNLRLIVSSGRVHGDYSAFNILWHNDKAVVIDFPQVIEIKHNPGAHAFLQRDVRSLCRSFMKQGINADETEILREVRKPLSVNTDPASILSPARE